MEDSPYSEDFLRMLDLQDEQEGKPYDLEERTLQNAMKVRDLVKRADKNSWNNEYIKQVVRSSASIGANYIEANESLGENDFLMKARISRREAKETKYWLRLLDIDANSDLESERNKLIQEAEELRKILSSILNKRIKNKN